MRQRPGMTLLVVAALVLGIGLNAAIFSVLNAVVLRPLPIFEPDRVVWLHTKINQSGASLGTSYPDYLDWKSQSQSFEDIAPMYALGFTLTGSGPAEHVKATALPACGLKVWGIGTVLGRGFTSDDDRPAANRVVILNYPFWQTKFGGDPNVLGKSLALDDHSYTVIGVLQPTPLGALRYSDVYVAVGPLLNAHMMERDTRWFFPIARLKPNVTLAQAQVEMNTIAGRLAAQYPATNKDMGIRILGMVDWLTADGRKPLLLLMVASSLIFLLASVNVMTVFLGSTMERRQELSVRLALGATRPGLLRQLLIQALILATVGGALGLVLTRLALAFFVYHFPAAFLRFQETTIDFRVVVVTLATTLLAALIATLLPAIFAFNLNAGNQLTSQWSSSALPKYRVLGRGALILFEVSLASGLSVVAGLLIKSLYQVEKVDLGFNPAQVYSFRVNPPLIRYNDAGKRIAVSKSALEKLVNLPGMRQVSAIASLPLTTQGWLNTIEVDGQSPLFGQKLMVEDESVLPGFFETMRLPLLQGRDFTDADREGSSPVIIVDDVLAAKLWPSQDPLGKRIRVSFIKGETVRWREVVGVVKEIRHFGPERSARWMQAYVPQYQDPAPVFSFVINTTLPEAAVKTATEKALHELDRDLPIEDFKTMDDYLDTFLSGRRVSLLLLSAFAGIGVLLGTIGIYGVVASSVIQRRREIAIRMAVGATPSGTIFLITRLGLLATLAGVLIGSAIVVTLARLLASMLFGITALDPAVYVLGALMVIFLALIASFVPATRLLRLNIQEILRQ